MLWQPIGNLLFCPECRHGREAHYDPRTSGPIPCIGAAGKWWDPLTGDLAGPGSHTKLCRCDYAS